MVIAEVNQTKSTDSAEAAQIAATGVRNPGLTVASGRETPGMPPSREKAKSMREAEVTVARPQSHCETKIAR